uniref:DND microRNA-mediated repression inhibitor 1 n=1 Tax=Varanus komodoensis TaxID=61221 RepID=A0A8D2J3Q4_VARKO
MAAIVLVAGGGNGRDCEVNRANKAALLAWAEETGTVLVQVNGQRKYGGPPPGWTGGAPQCGTEVFIGKIPQVIYEDRLIPLFRSAGKLYEFRLMMTFSGLNRGFAYAKYATRHSAQQAIAALNNFEIQAGSRLLVCRSTDKCELCIDGLAATVSERQLWPMLQELTAGVLSVALHPSPFRRQRQLAEVKYSSHQAAAVAKKALVEGSLRVCGDQIAVDWLKPNLKQELHSTSVQTIPEVLPSACGDRVIPSRLSPELADCHRLPPASRAVEYLNSWCKERQLGLPVFLTKCLQGGPEGSLQFWYQVVIPKYPFPFSGFIWVKSESSGSGAHEKAKNAVALQLLGALAGWSRGSD